MRLTFFHSAATCLHLPAKLTPETVKHEARKRRANERHVVGCCEVLAGGLFDHQQRTSLKLIPPRKQARKYWLDIRDIVTQDAKKDKADFK